MRILNHICSLGLLAVLALATTACDSKTETKKAASVADPAPLETPSPAEKMSKMQDKMKPMAKDMEMPMSMAGENMAGMQHSHAPIGVPDGVAAPGLSLTLYKDTQDGYNLQLITTAFKLGPPPRRILSMDESMQATTDGVTGFLEGHAHLYINGEKIQRIYGSDIHIPENLIPTGTNQVTVTLNNHGHMYWIIGGRQVLATLFVNPESEPIIANRFESFPAN